MRSILFLVAIIFIVGWIVGFYLYGSAGIIHFLLVLALISLILGFIRRA